MTPERGRKLITRLPNGVTTTDLQDGAGRLLRTESKATAGTVLQRLVYECQRTSGATISQVRLRSKETEKLSTSSEPSPHDFARNWPALADVDYDTHEQLVRDGEDLLGVDEDGNVVGG